MHRDPKTHESRLMGGFVVWSAASDGTLQFHQRILRTLIRTVEIAGAGFEPATFGL
jgi:hypothetical protein